MHTAWTYYASKILAIRKKTCHSSTPSSKTSYRLAHSPLPSGGSGRKIGGQLIIISPKWSASITDFKKDETGLGILTGLYLMGRTQRILILSTYWPQKRNHSEAVDPFDCRHEPEVGSPWLKMVEWLKKHRPNCKYSPLEYIQTTLNRWAFAHESKFSQSCQLLVGDMNAEWTVSRHNRGCHTPLSEWADTAGWSNHPRLALANSALKPLHTQWNGSDSLAYGVSWIDHILFQNNE